MLKLVQGLQSNMKQFLSRDCFHGPHHHAEKDIHHYVRDQCCGRHADDFFDDVAHQCTKKHLSTAIVTDTTRKMATQDLDSLLLESAPGFERKLSAMEKALEDIRHTNAEILAHMREGVHTLVKDQDIQTVWYRSKWGLIVESRHFGEGTSMLSICVIPRLTGLPTAVYTHFLPKILALANAESEEWTLDILSRALCKCGLSA
jgi:hypothetical protein